MAIRKEIFVTQKRLDPILNVTYKSDLLQIELDVQDFDIPEGTTAIAYAIGESRVVKEEKCSVVGNIISFSPANLFEEGKGLLQIELTNAGKQLSTFKIKVECEGLVKESGVDPSEEMDLTKATVVASDIREGKIAFGSTGEIEGILEEASNPCNIGSGGSVQYLGSTNVSDPFFNVTKKQVGDVIVNTGTTVSIYVDADKFGDADTSDVASGKTFTSANGLLLTGTGNIEGSTEENTTTGTAIKTGTLTVDTDCESAEVNTGLSSVDAFILYKAPDTTQHNTHGWIYSEPCTGVMQYSYGSTIKIDWWKEDSNYIEINGGVVTAKRYMPSSTPYPVLAGEYSWMAVGTE